MSTPEVHDLESDDLDAALARALAVLDAGELVCVPTETVYGIGCRADLPAALQKLRAIKGNARPFTLHLGDPEDVFALGQGPAQARRLVRAYMPGPLTIVLDATEKGKQFAAEDGTLGLRVVENAFTRRLSAEAAGPIAMASANLPGEPAPQTLEHALEAIGDHVQFAADGGTCPVGAASSVVRVSANGEIRMLREAALERSSILTRAATVVLFLCSGNTCRSPMAEVLARRTWANDLDVQPAELIDHGILVVSAGTAAQPGMPASENAIRAMAEIGEDLTAHSSRPLEAALLARANRTLCMGMSHYATAHAILESVGGPLDTDSEPPELLAGDHEIADPFGGPLEIYQLTRDQIAAALPELPE